MANYCTKCGISLAIGNESDYCNEHGGPLLSPDAQIRCPYCKETIFATAKKCRFCGEFLDSERPPVHASPLARTPKQGEIICPNPRCGYIGRPKRVATRSVLVGLVLLCFFILPGVLYFMFKRNRYRCPRCGVEI